MSQPLLDAAGRRRSPATLPDFHAGRPPRNKGIRYPADPPTIEEIIAVMRRAGDGVHGRRLRGLIVTSNKPFSGWGEIFGDDVVAAAMIDRLVHHAEILALKGDSYRLKDRDLGRVPNPADDQ